MIAILLAAAALAAQQPQAVPVPQSPPGPAVSSEATAAALSDTFRTWLAAEMATCAAEPLVARRRAAKLRFDLVHARVEAVLGEQRMRDALAEVIGDSNNVRFPDCPAADAIERRIAEFEASVGRLTEAAFAGEMMPFRADR
jgi:hypothetical protein